jgi:hypothetical protein
MIRTLIVLCCLVLPVEAGDLARRVGEQERRDAAADALRERARAAAAKRAPADWVKARDAESAAERERVGKYVEWLAGKVRGSTFIDDDLRAFLARPDAAAILYHEQVRPLLRRNRVSRALGGAFAPTDDGKLRVLKAAADLLDRAKKEKPLAVGKAEEFVLREIGRMYARRVTGDADEWRKLLASRDVLRLAALARPRKTMDAAKLLRDHTEFGRMLVFGKDGRCLVNRHCYFEMDEFLRRVGKIASYRDLAADWHVRGREFTPVEESDALTKDRVTEIQAELANVMALDPAKLEYDAVRIDLLRSSAFYNPRTGYGSYWWTVPFADHPSARLFGTFGWTAKTTGSVEEFLAKIDARVPALRSLAKTHENLIVIINTMPPWLSVRPNSGTFEGDRRENAEAHPPKDMKIWCEMIRGMVSRLKAVEGVNWYYEFWNEPDGQYWQSGIDEFLELYAATAKTVRAADPKAKVGGCAPNQWDGKLRTAKDRDAINLELIRYAAKKKLPFDFVSWHHFGRPIEAIGEAKARYTEELQKHGFDPLPEFLVTEWAVAYRGMPYASSHFSEMMLGFFREKVDVQTIACWEEFHAKPDPKHFAPWGLMTQQGVRKGPWFAHRFFDRIARGSLGVAVVTEGEERTAVVSKKADGVLDLLVWQKGLDPAFAAALETLKAGGFTKEAGRRYVSYDRLERAILEGGPIVPGLEKAFAAAAKKHRASPIRTPRIVLAFEGAESVEVLAAETVRMAHELKGPVVLGNRVTCPLKRYEVLHLTVRIR